MARLLGIKQPSLWELENQAGAEPSGRVLTGLCTHLHTTPEYIMDGAERAEDLEIEMQAAELLFAFRHTDENGRNALIAAARGLMASANSSMTRPYVEPPPPSPPPAKRPAAAKKQSKID